MLSPVDEFRFLRGIEFLAAAGCKPNGHTRWLDLGCHQGQFLRLLIDRLGLVRPIGSDDWGSALKSVHDADWDYVQGDFANGLPAVDGVDVISALEVIEHIIDTDRFLKEIRALLKPGGWLLLSTPNISSLRNRATVPFGAYPVGLEYQNLIHHVRLYNPSVLTKQLTQARFCNVRVRGVSFLPLRFVAGRSRIGQALGNWLPSLCNNFLAIARTPD